MSAFVINPYSFASDNITSFEFLQSTTDAANLATYTLTGVNFGAAAANRRILVAFATRSGNAGHSLSSATIGGVSATIVAQHSASVGGGVSLVGIIAADVPTGTTGTVAITLSNGAVRFAMGTYRVQSAAALTVADSAFDDTVAGGNAASISTTVDVEKGILIAVASTFSAGQTLSFSGIANNDFNATVEAGANTASASETIAAPAAQTITATRSSGTDWIVILGACLK